MTSQNRKFSIIVLLLSLLWLAACSPVAPTSAPTQDLNPVRTEVAATVLAQVAQQLALTPSVTPFPSPTETLRPSSTPDFTPTTPPNATEILASGTASALANNKAQWVSQSIVDNTVFAPGATFTMVWRLKNTGTSTWTQGYMLRYFSGDAFGAPKEILLDQEVLPGGEVEITANMKAPTTPGTYRSDWVMADACRASCKEPVFLKIIVATTPTPTATRPTPTPTAPTPTATAKP